MTKHPAAAWFLVSRISINQREEDPFVYLGTIDRCNKPTSPPGIIPITLVVNISTHVITTGKALLSESPQIYSCSYYCEAIT